MTKLLLITLRWMKKDRKRTLLSFLSVLLAVYMMTVLGIYFSSAVSFLRSKEKYENGSYHADFHCDTLEQAEKIAGNAAVSESCSFCSSDYGFIRSYVEKYKGRSKGSTAYVPTFTLNAKTYLDNRCAVYVSGNADTLLSNKTLGKGRFPQKPGEITLDAYLAKDRKLDIGDTVVFRYEVRKGTVLCSEYTERMVGSGNDQSNQRVYNFKDKPDDEGLIVNNFITQIEQIYSDSSLSPDRKRENAELEIDYLFTLSDTSTDRTRWNWGYYDEDPYTYMSSEKIVKTSAVCKTEKEPVEVVEYSARIVGLSSTDWDDGTGSPFYLCDKDEAARQIFPIYDVHCYTRISEGLDVDDEVEHIKKAVGLPDTYPDSNGVHDTAVLNDTLLFYEGRSLYDPGSADPMIILALLSVVLFVFVFFARLIINNAFELSSAYRLSQYSSLKTIGVSNKQMFVMVMSECLIYLIAALPIAMLLAFVTGKFIISKITDLKIFDALYGTGVTDRFFKLEISTVLMTVVLTVTVFSVLMSAYAVAIRIMKMPAVLTRAADGSKPPKATERSWLTRKLFGYSFGLAVRNAFRNKMRFFITLLATVVSGTLIITISSLIITFNRSDNVAFDADDPDYGCSMTSKFSDEQNFSDDYLILSKSELFSNIYVSDFKALSFTDTDTGIFTDEYIKARKDSKAPPAIHVFAITPRIYDETISSSVSYDELRKSGGVIVCSQVYESDEDKFEWKKNAYSAIKDGADKITVNASKGSSEKHSFDICGTYTLTNSRNNYYADDTMFTSVDSVSVAVPIENYYKMFKWLMPTEEGDLPQDAENVTISASLDFLSCNVTVVPGKEDEAKEFLEKAFGDRLVLEDFTPQKQTSERIAKALRIAGLSLAVIIFSVALINIVSTSAAEIVNRRRELSMLRACGMSLRQIFKMLRLEVLFFSGVSTALSAVLGKLFASFIFEFISNSLDMNRTKAIIPFVATLSVFVITLVLMMVIYLLPLRNMSKTPVAQDIRIKE